MSSDDDQLSQVNRVVQSQQQYDSRKSKKRLRSSVLNLEETSKESSVALDNLIKELQLVDSELQKKIH